jgi:hypothetical protein
MSPSELKLVRWTLNETHLEKPQIYGIDIMKLLFDDDFQIFHGCIYRHVNLESIAITFEETLDCTMVIISHGRMRLMLKRGRVAASAFT